MQSREDINYFVSEMKKELNKRYKHISLRTYPFEDEIIDVKPTKHLFYSEDYWLDNLFFITKKGFYFTTDDILKDSVWESDDNQPYGEFLTGIIKIARVVKFNEENIGNLLKLILEIVSQGKIEGFIYKSGPKAGKKYYFYCQFGYSWIGKNIQNKRTIVNTQETAISSVQHITQPNAQPTTKQCPHCKTELRYIDKYCKHCGRIQDRCEGLTILVTCRECSKIQNGALIDIINSNYCTYCGSNNLEWDDGLLPF